MKEITALKLEEKDIALLINTLAKRLLEFYYESYPVRYSELKAKAIELLNQELPQHILLPREYEVDGEIHYYYILERPEALLPQLLTTFRREHLT